MPQEQTITFQGKDYDLFIGLRTKFRLKRVDGVIDRISIIELSSGLNIPEGDAVDILSGNIPVVVNEGDSSFSYTTGRTQSKGVITDEPTEETIEE